MTTWRLDIERIRVMGASRERFDTAEVRALVAAAVQQALESAPLPNGRAMIASVKMQVPSLATGAAIAGAVAAGVSRAAGGKARG